MRNTSRRLSATNQHQNQAGIVDGCTIRPSIAPLVLGSIPVAVFWGFVFGVDRQVKMVFLSVALLWTLYRLLKVAFSYYGVKYIIQKEMVIKHVGILSKVVIQVRTADIRSVSTVQDIFGRWLRYGDVNIFTAATGGAEIVMRGVPNPAEIVSALDARRGAAK